MEKTELCEEGESRRRWWSREKEFGSFGTRGRGKDTKFNLYFFQVFIMEQVFQLKFEAM